MVHMNIHLIFLLQKDGKFSGVSAVLAYTENVNHAAELAGQGIDK
jgi:hypothetical protein